MCKLRGCSQIIFLKINFNVKKNNTQAISATLCISWESLEKVLRKSLESVEKS